MKRKISKWLAGFLAVTMMITPLGYSMPVNAMELPAEEVVAEVETTEMSSEVAESDIEVVETGDSSIISSEDVVTENDDIEYDEGVVWDITESEEADAVNEEDLEFVISEDIEIEETDSETIVSEPMMASESDFTFSGGTITKYLGTDESIIIPETIGGVSVTAIGKEAFKNKTTLVNVQFPTSLTSIGDGAFYGCSSITTIDLSNTQVNSIGYEAFRGCSASKAPVFPQTLRSIGQSAFLGCMSNDKLATLESLIIPAQITSIGPYAFQNCKKLGKVTFEEYTGSEKLDPIKFVNTYAECDTFNGCIALKTIVLSNRIEAIPNRFAYNCTALKEVSWDSSLKSIGENAFYNCIVLVNLDFSNTNLTSVGSHAFADCKSTTAPVFPQSIRVIGSSAFYGCMSDDYAVKYENLIIPSEITEIGPYAFQKCTKLGTVTFENYTGTIALDPIVFGHFYSDYHTFESCSSLKKITLSNRVDTVVPSFAGNCEKLAEVVWPNTLIKIGAYAFDNCSSLINLDFSNTKLEVVEEGAFRCCKSAMVPVFPESIREILGSAFEGSMSKEGMEDQDLVIPSELISLGAYAFKDCKYLGTVTFNEYTGAEELENIKFLSYYSDYNQFSDCDRLTKIVLSNRISSIPSAFCANDTNLAEINWRNELTEIGNSAFLDCSSLVNLDLSNTNLTSVGEHAFARCTSSTAPVFPKTLRTIGDYAFSNSSLGTDKKLGAVVIPVNVTKIGYGAFAETTKLGKVEFAKDDLGYIDPMFLGDNTFSQSENLSELIVSDRIQEIPSSFASYCSNLTTISIADSVNKIDSGAFYVSTYYIEKKIPTKLIGNCSAAKSYDWENSNRIIADSYTVVYHSNYPTDMANTMSRQSMAVGYDSTLRLYSFDEPNGYEFVSWNTKPDGTGKYYKSQEVVKNLASADSEIDLYAHWSPIVYSISYGILRNTGNPNTYTVETPDIVLKPGKMTGRSFVKWINPDNYNKEITVIPKGTTGNLYLEPVWRDPTYEIVFVENVQPYETERTDFQTAGLNDTVKLYKAHFDRFGYTFKYWNTKRDGTGVRYNDEQSVSKLADADGKIQLYAIWDTYKVTVTFETGEGSEIEPMKASFGSAYNLPNAKRWGYEFLGWYTAPEGGRQIKAEDIVNDQNDITVYAKWNKKTYVAQKPGFDIENGVILDVGDRISISAPDNGAKIYYTMDGSEPNSSNITDTFEGTHLYEEAIVIDIPASMKNEYTIKAIATLEGYNDSGVSTISFTVRDESEEWGEVVVNPEEGIDDKSEFGDADEVPAGFWVRGIEDCSYTGKAVTQDNLRVYYGKKLLEINKDYTVKYANNVNASNDKIKATVTIIGRGNYSDSIVETFMISPLDISDEADSLLIDGSSSSVIYVEENGKTQKGKAKSIKYVKDGVTLTLKENVDFTYFWPNTSLSSTNPEDLFNPESFVKASNTAYKVQIIGKGNYAGTNKNGLSVLIVPKQCLMSKVSAPSISSRKYTGNEIMPYGAIDGEYSDDVNAIVSLADKNGNSLVKYGTTALVKDVDYEISYRNNINAGVGQVVLIGKNRYVGEKVINFNIIGTGIGTAKFASDITSEKKYADREDHIFEPVIADKNSVDSNNNNNASLWIEDKQKNKTYLNGILKSEYDELTDEDVKRKYDYTYEYVTEFVKDENRYKTTSEIGTVKINFYGVSGFTGKVTKQYKITGDAVSKLNITLANTSAVYTGSNIEPAVLVMTKPVAATSNKPGVAAKILTKDDDYILKYDKNVNVGTATVTVIGINGYTGSVKKTFKITQYDINADASGKITVDSIGTVKYQKGGAKPVVTVKASENELVLNKDYTVTYINYSKVNDGSNAKTIPTVKITGKGNYKGQLAVNYKITDSDISKEAGIVSITATDIVYKNAANICKPKIILIDSDGKQLKANTDYNAAITYKYAKDVMVVNMVQNGRSKVAKDVVRESGELVDLKNDIIPVGAEITAEITTSIPNKVSPYTGTRSVNFRYVSADISKATVSVQTKAYTGKSVTLSKDDITVKIGTTVLAKTDYEIVGYNKNIAKGTAQVIIKGVGNYGGTKTCNFTINAKSLK